MTKHGMILLILIEKICTFEHLSLSFPFLLGIYCLQLKTTHPKNSYLALGISGFLWDSSYKNGRKSNRYDYAP